MVSSPFSRRDKSSRKQNRIVGKIKVTASIQTFGIATPFTEKGEKKTPFYFVLKWIGAQLSPEEAVNNGGDKPPLKGWRIFRGCEWG